MANLPPVIKQRYFDSNGNPLAGGKLHTYQAGTTTPQATYTDQGGGTESANPIVLDASGEASMWLDPELSYKFVLTDSYDVTQWTVDNVVGLLSTGSVITASIADDAVTQAKIADDAVGADQLRDDASTDANRAVTTNHIRDSAVTTGKINDLAVTTGKIAANAVTRAKLAALGQQISSSCGEFSSTSGTFVDVTNLSVTITTSGRPVYLALIPDGTVSEFNIGSHLAAGSSSGASLKFLRDSTDLGFFNLNATTTMGPCGYAIIDAPAAGTYTYKFQGKQSSGSNGFSVYRCKLVAYEL
jgi:hypothetical protein